VNRSIEGKVKGKYIKEKKRAQRGLRQKVNTDDLMKARCALHATTYRLWFCALMPDIGEGIGTFI
jgi:hypothetical protein